MLERARLLHLLFSVPALCLAACDQPVTPLDGGADAGPATCESLPPAFETGDPDGHAEPLGAAPGEVRAGRLEAADLPVDRTGLGTWAAGDFVLANDQVALIIEDAGASDLYDPFGGRPVGVARVQDGALVEAGDFNEILLGFGSFLVESESVTVLNDGSDGEAAVIRAVGPLGRLEFAGELLTSLLPGDFSDLPAALDYTMEPGSNAIDLHVEVVATHPRGVRADMLVNAFFQHYRMPLWSPENGFGTPTPGATPMAAFIDDVGMSYAWFAGEDRELSQVIEQSGVIVYSQGPARVSGCTGERFHLGTMVLGGPGLPGLQRSLAARRGESLRTVTGVVLEDDGAAATDVRVHVRREDGTHFARLIPGADGTFSVDVPEETMSFYVFREGTALVGPVEVAADASTAELTMPAFGTIVVHTTDPALTPGDDAIPARVQLIPSGGAPEVPGDLGEQVQGNGRSHVAFTTTGSVTLKVDPGEYEVIVSRGFEYGLVTATVTVGAGATMDVAAELSHVVDTEGVMCADYHIHTHRSPDSPDSPQRKLMGLIADGLEIAVRSDHEWVNDFQPLIEDMGLERYAFGITGEELTTFAWGHFGVFPLEADPTKVNNSAVSWVGRLPPEVFDEARARPEAPAFIINHPRGAAFSSYFTAAGYDPVTGAVDHPELWDDEFTLVEVFNDDDFYDVNDEGERTRTDVVDDWFALLNSGRRVFAVGSSDSHRIYGSPVGYPRTCLALGTDDPTTLTPDMVRDVTAAGHSVVSGGIYLNVEGPDGALPGDEVMGAGEEAMFDVTVQAACWIQGQMELEVIVDGVVTETIPVDEPCPARLNATGAMGISVPVAPDGSWVVFHVSSDMDLRPLHPGRMPFAVSNPVFLQR